ncbi:hypothetical protein ACWATR_24885 [Nostoc sp. UIC 10890]
MTTDSRTDQTPDQRSLELTVNESGLTQTIAKTLTNCQVGAIHIDVKRLFAGYCPRARKFCVSHSNYQHWGLKTGD